MENILPNLDLLFEEHKHLIRNVIWRNRPLLSALRLEDDDVAQELAIKMLSAIEKYNPKRSASLETFLRYSLQYAILTMKQRFKPSGVTGIPNGNRLDFISLDSVSIDGCPFELPCDDDLSCPEFSEVLENLTEQESEAISLKIQGFSVKRKAYVSALDNVRHKYTAMYVQ